MVPPLLSHASFEKKNRAVMRGSRSQLHSNGHTIDALRPDNGGVSGQGYSHPFALPTPRPILPLLKPVTPSQSVQRVPVRCNGAYFSGSQSFVYHHYAGNDSYAGDICQAVGRAFSGGGPCVFLTSAGGGRELPVTNLPRF